MTDDESCHKCGDPASFAAADQDGVFRPVCRECFSEDRLGVLSQVNEKLEDWRLLLIGGLCLVGVGIKMQFTTVPQVIPLPGWWYIALGIIAAGAGLRELRKWFGA